MATFPTSTDDDGTGTTGTIIDQAYMYAVRDYIGAAWTTRAYSSGNYSASGSMTWTVESGDVVTDAYVEVGKTMLYSALLTTTTVGGTASTELRITIPNGRTSTKSMTGNAIGYNNLNQFNGFWQTDAGGTTIKIYVDALATTNWTLDGGVGRTQVRLSCQFEID